MAFEVVEDSGSQQVVPTNGIVGLQVFFFRFAKPAGAKRVQFDLLPGDFYRLGETSEVMRTSACIRFTATVRPDVQAVFASRQDGVTWLPDGVDDVQPVAAWRKLCEWPIGVYAQDSGDLPVDGRYYLGFDVLGLQAVGGVSPPGVTLNGALAGVKYATLRVTDNRTDWMVNPSLTVRSFPSAFNAAAIVSQWDKLAIWSRWGQNSSAGMAPLPLDLHYQLFVEPSEMAQIDTQPFATGGGSPMLAAFENTTGNTLSVLDLESTRVELWVRAHA